MLLHIFDQYICGRVLPGLNFQWFSAFYLYPVDRRRPTSPYGENLTACSTGPVVALALDIAGSANLSEPWFWVERSPYWQPILEIVAGRFHPEPGAPTLKSQKSWPHFLQDASSHSLPWISSSKVAVVRPFSRKWIHLHAFCFARAWEIPNGVPRLEAF